MGTATALIAITTAYWQMFALRFIAGIGSTMFTISAMGLVVRLAPREIRGKASSAYATAFLLGNIVGPVLGAALAALGMRIPFVIYGACVWAATAIVWRKMPKSIGRPHATAGGAIMTVRQAWRDSAFRCAVVSGFANGWSNFGVRVAVLPLFAASVFHHGGSIAGLALAAFALGNAAALQVSGRLSDRIGRRPLILLGLAVNGGFTAALGFASGFWPLMITSAIAGVGGGLLNPPQQAALADIIGNERSGGGVLSAFQMAQDCGTISGPIVVGAIATRLGFAWAFSACGVVAAVAFVVWMFGRETLPTKAGARSRSFRGFRGRKPAPGGADAGA